MSEMTTNSANPLVEAVVETFGEMAFLDALPTDEAPGDINTQVFSIEVRGPQMITLVLDLPTSIKQQIVENIHAMPWEELQSSVIDDCLLEFLNVLGGAFGTMVFGEDAQYKLSFPEVAVAVRDAAANETSATQCFDAAGTVFVVHQFTQNG